jgi:hypothetical protein
LKLTISFEKFCFFNYNSPCLLQTIKIGNLDDMNVESVIISYKNLNWENFIIFNVIIVTYNATSLDSLVKFSLSIKNMIPLADKHVRLILKLEFL